MNEIYSVKSYKDLFVYTCFDVNERKLKQFVISKTRNDISDIISHLEKVENQIGFGNLASDYYYLHNIIDLRNDIINMKSPEILSILGGIKRAIDNGEPIIINKRYMAQLDLQRFWGFNSPDKNISLTDIKIALKEANVNIVYSDVPSLSEEKIEEIRNSALSDVRTIFKLYLLTSGKTKLENYKNKNLISARYNLCNSISFSGINCSPTYFAKLYFLNLYNKLGGKYGEQELISRSKSNTSKIELKDCVPYYAIFSSHEFSGAANAMVKSDETYSYTTNFHGLPLKFGMGGVHGYKGSGKYTSDINNYIVDIDVVSMYATIATELNIKPKHMDDIFIKTMKTILNERISCLNKDDEVSKGLVVITKNILNYIYGKTKESDSPFYDPEYSIKVTFAAQMLMCRFMEALANRIPDINFIMVNTDAITFCAPRNSKESIIEAINKIRGIIPSLRFKIKNYDVLYVKDVNNYIGSNDDKITAKGIFDYNIDILKDNSAKVISEVVRDHLIHKESIDEAIKKYDILDFLIKVKNNNRILYSEVKDGHKVSELIQSPSRYYYCNDYKSSGYISKVVRGVYNTLSDNYPVALLNNIFTKDKDINYRYYRQEIFDIVNAVKWPASTGLLLL